MGKVEKQVVETLQNKSKQFEGQETTRKFEKAARDFDKMVERGETQKRGNQLINVEDAPRKKYTFNS